MNRRRILIATALVALLGAAVWLVWPAREPRYQGRPLSEWLSGPGPGLQMWIGGGTYSTYETPPKGLEPQWNPLRFGSGKIRLRSRAWKHYQPDYLTDSGREAVKQAGVEAVPTLLRMLRAQDTPLKVKLVALMEKQHWVKFTNTPALAANIRAREAFEILGSAASNYVPALIKIFDANISEPSRSGAIEALGWIGPAASNAVPAILRAADNTNFSQRITVLWSLGMIHARPELVVPVLFKLMHDTNEQVRLQADYALGAYGPEAKASVLPFMGQIAELDKQVKYDLVYDLLPIAPDFAAQLPEARETIEDCLAHVTNSDEWERIWGITNLVRLPILMELSVPALKTALRDGNARVREAATNALRAIDPEAARKAGIE